MSSLKDAVEQAQPDDELKATLVRTQRDLRRARAKTEDLVAAVYQAVRGAIVVERSMPAVARPARDARRK